MSENLSRRGILRIGTCAPFAAGVFSMASPAKADPSYVGALWDSYNAIRNEGDRLYKIWCEACERASVRTPDLPEGLLFPNRDFCPWLQIDREGVVWAIRKGKAGTPLGLHYRPEILADFLSDPPEIHSSLDSERVPRILGLIRELLPKAESYMAAVKEAWREADEIQDACAFDDLIDRQFDAADALMNAEPANVNDFIFKAKLIRNRLDDDACVDREARKLADQMITFWGQGLLS